MRMVTINIISMRNILHLSVIYSDIRLFTNEKEASIDGDRELSEDILNDYLCIDFGFKSKLCMYALNSIKQDVKFESFKITEPDKVKMWKKRLEGERATWLVSYNKTDISTVDSTYELKVIWSADNSKCFFCMGKKDLLNIFDVMSGYKNGETIQLSVKTSDKIIIPISSIKCVSNLSIIIYRPFFPSSGFSFIENIIEGGLDYYYESYTKYLFFLFRNIREQKETNQLEIYKLSNDVIILNFTQVKVPLLLFGFQYMPNLEFFGDFSIKLGYREQKIPYVKGNPKSHINIIPTVFLKFKRLVETLDNNLTFQLNLYKRNIRDRNRFINLFRKSSHFNLNFSSGTILSFEKQLVDVFIKFKYGKSGGYDFTLYFLNATYITKFHLRWRLLNSIEKIRIETFGKTKDAREELYIYDFSKVSIFYPVELKFHISKDTSKEPKIANNILYDILETKNGFFSIQVQTIDKTIIEYKINLTPESMCVLSCNKIKEHIEMLSDKNNHTPKWFFVQT